MTRTDSRNERRRRRRAPLLSFGPAFLLCACAGELEEDVVALIASNPPTVNSAPRSPNASSGTAAPVGTTPQPTPAGTGGAATGGAGGAAATGGMPGLGGAMGAVSLPAGCDPKAIIESPMKCGGGICHGSPGMPPMVQADLGNLFDDIETRLSDAPGASPACADQKIINTAAPAESLLLTKLSMTPPQCGDAMPIAFTITAEERTCLIAWAKGITGAP